jgi:hypothetical protein
MGIDLGNLAALRTFRVLRALKTVAIVPGEFWRADNNIGSLSEGPLIGLKWSLSLQSINT